jgi:hypothetical protein
MKPKEFCYWLQGYFEIAGDVPALGPQQVEEIRNHLALVFDKVTPRKEEFTYRDGGLKVTIAEGACDGASLTKSLRHEELGEAFKRIDEEAQKMREHIAPFKPAGIRSCYRDKVRC